jgi:sugar phosphate isomerase/epimerase
MTDGKALQLGVNLSFCVKRWVTPDLWAPLVRQELNLDLVQLSFDLVDPTWPTHILERHAREIRRATAQEGIGIHSAFIGLAHYTFNQLLHPDRDVRTYAETWLARAYAFAASAGIERVGGPLGAIASRYNGREDDRIPEHDYDDLVKRVLRLGDRARSEGLCELLVEPTPLRRECPSSIEQTRQILNDTEGSATPWRLCLDWGHATFQPLYGADAVCLTPWLNALESRVGALHIQQTDFQQDRHWDFTVPGRVNPKVAAATLRLLPSPVPPVFLEVFYPFERDDASVIRAMKRSSGRLSRAFA